jgi:predicted transcriptional regulator
VRSAVLSESLVEVINLLKEMPQTADEVAKKLGVSVGTANKLLNYLISIGVVSRTKLIEKNKVGRPKYLYSLASDWRESLHEYLERECMKLRAVMEKIAA